MTDPKTMALVSLIAMPALFGAVMIGVDPSAPTGLGSFTILIASLLVFFLALGPSLARFEDKQAMRPVIWSVAAVGVLTPFLPGFADWPRIWGISASLSLIGAALWITSLFLVRTIGQPERDAWFGGVLVAAFGTMAAIGQPESVIRVGALFAVHGFLAVWAWSRWRHHIADMRQSQPS